MGAATAVQPVNKNLFGEIIAVSSIERQKETRNKNFKARNERIRTRFNELHNDKRIRYDDVMTTLSLEFCLAEKTILRALKGRN